MGSFHFDFIYLMKSISVAQLAELNQNT